MAVFPNGTRNEPITSSGFGPRRHPVTGVVNSFHYGWDTYGYTYNCAPVAGRVVFVGYNGGHGNQVQWDGVDGKRHSTSHNRSFLVKVGDWVSEGQPLAVQGTTGSSTGVHNHSEVRQNGVAIDPRPYLRNAVSAASAGSGSSKLIEEKEDEEMKPTVFRKTQSGKEWMLVAPWLSKESDPNQRGYIVLSEAEARAATRTYMRGFDTSHKVSRAHYIETQAFARKLHEQWLADKAKG